MLLQAISTTQTGKTSVQTTPEPSNNTMAVRRSRNYGDSAVAWQEGDVTPLLNYYSTRKALNGLI